MNRRDSDRHGGGGSSRHVNRVRLEEEEEPRYVPRPRRRSRSRPAEIPAADNGHNRDHHNRRRHHSPHREEEFSRSRSRSRLHPHPHIIHARSPPRRSRHEPPEFVYRQSSPSRHHRHDRNHSPHHHHHRPSHPTRSRTPEPRHERPPPFVPPPPPSGQHRPTPSGARPTYRAPGEWRPQTPGYAETIISEAPEQQQERELPRVEEDAEDLIRKIEIMGRCAMRYFGESVKTLVMSEWEATGTPGQYAIPRRNYEVGFGVLPVTTTIGGGGGVGGSNRRRREVLQPIPDSTASWGVRTGYDPRQDIYVAALLVRVPDHLGSSLSSSQIRAAYRRLAESAQDLAENGGNQQYGKYAVLFHFRNGVQPLRFYYDHLSDDAIVRVRRSR